MTIADRIEQQLFAKSSGASRARALLTMLRSGPFDRAAFTANGNAYFTPTAIEEFRASLAQLGGGLTIERFLLDYGSRKLQLVLRAEPGEHGRVEELPLSPVG